MLGHLFRRLAVVWSPMKCFVFCQKISIWLAIGCTVSLGYGLYSGLFVAPPDYQQGDAFRIIYIHVPFAILSLFFYAGVGFLNLIYLIWRIKLAELMAYSLASVGVVMTFLALLTGAIWGKPMWGTWWIWDARLTSELILLFLYFGYIALYDGIKRSQPKSVAPSVLAVLGLIDLPIIHYSVYWWQTLHQGATISRFGKPAIDASMLYPLLLTLVGLLLFGLYICNLKLQTEILKQFKQTHWIKQKVV